MTFKCSQCGKSTSRDTTPTYYELRSPHGLDDKSTWKPFCSDLCANQWVNIWFSNEEERNKKERKELNEQEMINSIKEIISTWEHYSYQHRTFINYTFTGELTPNDRSIILWLAEMWINQEFKALNVNWDTSLERIGVTAEEKDQSLEILAAKGWIKVVDDSITLQIPRKNLLEPLLS